MSRWMMIIAAGMLTLATSCAGSPTSQPAANTTATSAPAATAAPTIAATAIAVPSATSAPTAASTPTVNPTPTGAAAATPAATAAAGSTQTTSGDFVPKVRSVWDTAVGLDQMSGTCAKGSLLPVYGLVQITPGGDTLAWKNQEPAPYTMKHLQPNEYQYAGPSAIKDGVVTMTVTFIDAKSLQMLREFVANTDPGCMHTNVYTGTFQWDKP